MKYLLPFITFFAICAELAHATPDCYLQAKLPAHELPFSSGQQGAATVTGITPDGQSCREIPLYNGKPVMSQKIYAPLRQLYETYAKAIEAGNGNAARRAYAYLRPTPREFPLWLWLYNDPEGAPMPWGMDMAIKIMKLLQTDPQLYENAKQSRSNPIMDMRKAWPLLYLLMGGEVLPQEDAEKWHAAPHGNPAWLLHWRYPWAVIEENKQDNKRVLRMR